MLITVVNREGKGKGDVDNSRRKEGGRKGGEGSGQGKRTVRCWRVLSAGMVWLELHHLHGERSHD